MKIGPQKNENIQNLPTNWNKKNLFHFIALLMRKEFCMHLCDLENSSKVEGKKTLLYLEKKGVDLP